MLSTTPEKPHDGHSVIVILIAATDVCVEFASSEKATAWQCWQITANKSLSQLMSPILDFGTRRWYNYHV